MDTNEASELLKRQIRTVLEPLRMEAVREYEIQLDTLGPALPKNAKSALVDGFKAGTLIMASLAAASFAGGVVDATKTGKAGQ